MKYQLNRRFLLAGVSVVLCAGMSAALAAAAAADVGPGDDSPDRGSSDGSCRYFTSSSEYTGYATEGRPEKLEAIGLTDDQRLISFDVTQPGEPHDIGQVRLDADEELIGIDYRVQTGKLYGVGDTGGVYVLSTCDASATRVSQLSVDLDGTYFGVDFNPAADRLRIISDNGQNLRHNLNDDTTTEDGNLTYPPATDLALGVTGAAYTNNDLNPNTATTLFVIDTNLDQVAVQSPANAGQLAATGQLGVDANIQAGFDIYSVQRDDRTVYNKGFATLQVDDSSDLYEIDMLTGQAESQGGFGGHQVVDLALPLDQS